MFLIVVHLCMSISVYLSCTVTDTGNGGIFGFSLPGLWFGTGIGIGNGLGFVFLGFEVFIPKFGNLVLDLIVITDFFISGWDFTWVRDCGSVIFKFVV